MKCQSSLVRTDGDKVLCCKWAVCGKAKGTAEFDVEILEVLVLEVPLLHVPILGVELLHQAQTQHMIL